ncbi:MAG: CBS domain-containing protein [Oscillospiraceae bacterium]|nr:CBS domain-containing protein [Oscillospiraceae bacterium]
MLVSELMTNSVVSVSPDDTAQTAAYLLSRHNIGSLPVCSDGSALRGIVTDRDIVLRCVAAELDPAQTLVKEIMTRSPLAISPADDVRDAARCMAARQVRRTPVTEGHRVVGMLSLGDLSRTRSYDMETSRALAEISDYVRRI